MPANVEVKEDNVNAASEGIERAIERGLEKIGLLAEGYAKQKCPVDTGRLRNSITHLVESGEKAARNRPAKPPEDGLALFQPQARPKA